MSDLAEFVLARVADDEAVAREASPGPWDVDSEVYAEYVSDADGLAVISGARWGGEASVFNDTDDALHLVRWHPARVLAECEAKRRIVAAITAWLDEHSDEDHVPAGDDALCWLALPYADHPDYRAEWRP